MIVGGDPAASGGRRRRRRLLDEEMILVAALELIDETGELTMGALAARLGSTASSIYHHVSGRAAIIEALRARVGSQVTPPVPGGDWEAEIRTFVGEYREAFARHPRLIPLVTAQTVGAEQAVAAYEQVVRCLMGAGVPQRYLLLWVSVLDNFVLGSALDAAAPEDVWRRDGAGVTPDLDRAVEASPVGAARAQEAFALGVDALMCGLRVWLARPEGDRSSL